jgi:hypothetical protein
MVIKIIIISLLIAITVKCAIEAYESLWTFNSYMNKAETIVTLLFLIIFIIAIFVELAIIFHTLWVAI